MAVKLYMSIPELQSFIALNREEIASLEWVIVEDKKNIGLIYQDIEDKTLSEYCGFGIIKDFRRNIAGYNNKLRHLVYLQQAMKRELRHLYGIERDARIAEKALKEQANKGV